jgi:hypothetical protein
MPILKASLLRPGDVVLETGEPKIAASAGQGRFGHASLAISRLVWLEVGIMGVKLTACEFGHYEHDDDRFIGIEIEDDCLVRRRLEPLSAVDVWSSTFAEIGRRYASRAKLLLTTDLTPAGAAQLQHPVRGLREHDDALAPGRFCSEAAAVVLGLDETLISPDGLANAADLVDVTDAVLDVALLVEPHARRAELANLVAAMSKRTVPNLSGAIQALTKRKKAGGGGPTQEEADALEGQLNDALTSDAPLAVDIEKIEAEILGPVVS